MPKSRRPSLKCFGAADNLPESRPFTRFPHHVRRVTSAEFRRSMLSSTSHVSEKIASPMKVDIIDRHLIAIQHNARKTIQSDRQILVITIMAIVDVFDRAVGMLVADLDAAVTAK